MDEATNQEFIINSHEVIDNSPNDSAYNSPYDSAYNSETEEHSETEEDEEFHMLQFRNSLILLQLQEVELDIKNKLKQHQEDIEFEIMIGWLLNENGSCT
tara:strand:- start:1662 stop:1961 length:300 start_codon:yes stop_codon:yes gene_type:complete